MQQMLDECEHDIEIIRKKIKKLKKLPNTDRKNHEIAKWEDMLYDVMYRAGRIKEIMSREGGGKPSE